MEFIDYEMDMEQKKNVEWIASKYWFLFFKNSVGAEGAGVPVYMWASEDHLQQSVLFCYVVPKDRTQFIKLDGKMLLPVSYLPTHTC